MYLTEEGGQKHSLHVPANDLLVCKHNLWRTHMPRDNAFWIAIMCQIVGASLSVRKCKCRRIGTSSRTPCPLYVVSCCWWNVAHKHRLEFTHINAQLKCCGAT